MKNVKINNKKATTKDVVAYTHQTFDELSNIEREELAAVYANIPSALNEIETELVRVQESSGIDELASKISSLKSLQKNILNILNQSEDFIKDNVVSVSLNSDTEQESITDDGEIVTETITAVESSTKFYRVNSYEIRDDINTHAFFTYLLDEGFKYGIKVASVSMVDTDDRVYLEGTLYSLLNILCDLNPCLIDKIFKVDSTKFKAWLELFPDIRDELLARGFIKVKSEIKTGKLTQRDINLFNQDDVEEINIGLASMPEELEEEPLELVDDIEDINLQIPEDDIFDGTIDDHHYVPVSSNSNTDNN